MTIVVNTTVPSDPTVQCVFEDGCTDITTCTIRYGEDSSYINLPDSDASSDCQDGIIIIELSEAQQSDTQYYYEVTAVRNTASAAIVQGSFRTRMFKCDDCQHCERWLSISVRGPGRCVCLYHKVYSKLSVDVPYFF